MLDPLGQASLVEQTGKRGRSTADEDGAVCAWVDLFDICLRHEKELPLGVLHDGTPLPMAGVIAVMASIGLLARLTLVRDQPDAAAAAG